MFAGKVDRARDIFRDISLSGYGSDNFRDMKAGYVSTKADLPDNVMSLSAYIKRVCFFYRYYRAKYVKNVEKQGEIALFLPKDSLLSICSDKKQKSTIFSEKKLEKKVRKFEFHTPLIVA